MEIKELVGYYVNDTSQTLDVSFRLITDNEDTIRTDQINLDDAESFGLNLEDNNNDPFDSDDDDYFAEMIRSYESDFEVDEDELVSFLNEYYLVNPKKLPKPELF
jgi:hypothetical protein